MSTRPQGGVPAHAATSTSLAVLEVEHFVARTEAEPSSPVYLHVAHSTLRTRPARDPRCLPHIGGPSSALRSLFVPRIKHDEPGRVNQELNLRRSAVRWRLSGFSWTARTRSQIGLGQDDPQAVVACRSMFRRPSSRNGPSWISSSRSET